MSDDLFEKYLGNRLSGEESAQLKLLLAGDQRARARFVQSIQEWQLFSEAARQVTGGAVGLPVEEDTALRGAPAHHPDAVRRRRGSLRAGVVRRRQPLRLAALLLPLTALAACLTVAVLVAPGAPRAESIGTITLVKNGVMLIRGEQKIPALSGTPLFVGDSLNVAAEGQAALRYADDTRMDIAPSTSLVLVAAQTALVKDQGKRVTINRGTVTAEVSRQPVGRPMIFLTPNAQATVLGTKLTLDVLPTSTRLEVEHGLVSLSRRSDRKEVAVGGGQCALVATGTEFVTKPTTNELPPVAEERHQGLKADYFADVELSKLRFSRIDPTVSFDLGLEAPFQDMDPVRFSVRWSGEVQAAFSETCTFHIYADSGVRLWVGDHLVIDAWSDQLAKDHQGAIALEAGKRYPLRLEYVQPKSGMMIKFSWAGPSQPLELVPSERLSPAP